MVATGSMLYVADYASGLVTLPLQCAGTTSIPIGPGDSRNDRPALGPAFPNPSADLPTTVPMKLTRPGRVVVQVLDVAGREVRRLLDRTVEPGERSVVWDGRDAQGCRFPRESTWSG